jgi:hypothetical protein
MKILNFCINFKKIFKILQYIVILSFKLKIIFLFLNTKNLDRILIFLIYDIF